MDNSATRCCMQKGEAMMHARASEQFSAHITRTVRMKMTNTARGRNCTVLVASAGNARTSRSRACTRVMAGARRASAPVTG